MKQNLPSNVEVIDVTLRDGFQNQEIFIPTEAKLWLADRLIDAGFHRLEVGTFSHVKYVPQFKDILDVLRGLPKKEELEYTVLALNTKGCERVVEALESGLKIDRVISAQLATSEAYARKNMNRTHEELFEESKKNLDFLHRHGIKKVCANVGTIFGCPIQGEMPLEKAYEFADRVFDMGFDEIEHSDPDGIAAPTTIYEYFTKILAAYPDTSMHSFHIHDIRGMGLTGYYAAMEAGITVFDSSLGGIGGQVANIVDRIPVKGTGEYYFDTKRTGLVETCDFVSMLNAMDIQTGIDEKKCYAATRMLERILGKELASFTSSLL